MNEELGRLLRATRLLEEATGARLAVIGGVARGAWADARNTLDVDVVLDSADVTAIVAAAPQAGLVAVPDEVAALAPSGMTRLRLPDHPTGRVRLDVIAATHPYYLRVVERATIVRVGDDDVRVASAEDVVLLKLLADRPQDRADVAAIVATQGDALDRDLLRREAAVLDVALPNELA